MHTLSRNEHYLLSIVQTLIYIGNSNSMRLKLCIIVEGGLLHMPIIGIVSIQDISIESCN